MKTAFTFLPLFIITLYLAGCSSSGSTYQSQSPLNRVWILQNLNGKTADNTNFPNGLPWMEIKANLGEMGGNTGCNVMGGTMHAANDKIVFYNIISTKIYCEGVAEQEFLNALESSNSWQIENGRLFLQHGDVVLAVFEQGEKPLTQP